MRQLNGFLFTVIGLMFASTVFAKPAYYESVLTPGARLVAGDAKKGEFFIIGPSVAAAHQVQENGYTVATKKVLPHVKMAASRPATKLAVKQTNKLAAKKTLSRARFATNRKPSAVSKIHIAKIDRALQRAMLQAERNRLAKAKPLASVLKTAMLSKKAAALMVPHPFISQKVHSHRAYQQAAKKRRIKNHLALNR